ncbi:MAG: hypothetical protein ACREPV_00410 [Lysobacter sp.]
MKAETSVRIARGLALGMVGVLLCGCQALPANLRSMRNPVATSIGDAYPTAPWLQVALQDRRPQPLAGDTIRPGYYTVDVQSYCLHAGAWGPTNGAGYEIGPLIGRAAPTIAGVLRRSAEHPEISQRDVQRLIWIIEARGLDESLDPAFAARVAPLLQGAPTLLTALESRFDLNALLPAEVQNALDTFTRLERQLVDMSISFSDLERIAVPAAPATVRTIDEGHWTFLAPGYYLRAFPDRYSHTRLEIVRPATYQVTRDELGRMTSLATAAGRIDIGYEGAQPQSVSAAGGPALRQWPVSSIRLSDSSGTHVLDQPSALPAYSDAPNGDGATGAQAVLDQVDSLHQFYDSLPDAAAAGEGAGERTGLEQIHDYVDRVDRVRETWETIADAQQQLDRSRHPDEGALRDLTDMEFLHEGLEAGARATDKRGQAKWLGEWMARVGNAYLYAACVLDGACPPPGTDWDDPEFDPSGWSAIPGDTGAQRLGLSSRRSSSSR